jgi:hypothetical protein
MPRAEERQAIQEGVWDLLKGLRGEHQLKELCRELNNDHCNIPLSSRYCRSATAQELVEARQVEEPVLLTSAGAQDDFHAIYTSLRSDDLSLGRERLLFHNCYEINPTRSLSFPINQNRWHFVNMKFHEQVSHHRRILGRITA